MANILLWSDDYCLRALHGSLVICAQIIQDCAWLGRIPIMQQLAWLRQACLAAGLGGGGRGPGPRVWGGLDGAAKFFVFAVGEHQAGQAEHVVAREPIGDGDDHVCPGLDPDDGRRPMPAVDSRDNHPRLCALFLPLVATLGAS